jgi:tRNA A37 methylthiotransferase MiaB
LPDLIRAICALEYDFKLRVGMMNIASVQDTFEELLTAFECAKVYKFLHLPVQSGSDRLLSLMERGHTVSDFVRCVSKFKQRYRHGTISTDFIVGFPTETDADFQLTRQLLQDIKPLKVNITRFSPREGTAAVSLCPVTPRVVKDRSRILTVEHHRVAHEQNRKFIGKKYAALAVEKGKNRSTILYNDSYRPIVIPGVLPLGTKHAVKVIEATPTYLLGILD